MLSGVYLTTSSKIFPEESAITYLDESKPKNDIMWLIMLVALGLVLGFSAFAFSSKPPSAPVVPTPAPIPSPEPTPDSVSVDQLAGIAERSACAAYGWGNRGKQPAYVRGMALVFGRAYCKLMKGDAGANATAVANTGIDSKDAISWYNSNFARLSMTNKKQGVDTLRHTYVLLIGLGMRESSGKYCTGYDSGGGSGSRTSNGAEAGLFQTSYNALYEGKDGMNAVEAKAARDLIANPGECFLSQFKTGMRGSCDSHGIQGSGSGAAFQRLNKSCPAFAAQFAALALRSRRRHYGPLNRKEAELRSECDGLLAQVELAIENNPKLCSKLL